MSSVFIAHSSHDKAFARRLTQDLQAYGVRVWIDEAEVLIGDSLVQKIQTAITEMKYLGALLSEHSVQSAWVQKELEVALSVELRDRDVKVLPILIDDCTIPPFLIGKLYADFRLPGGYDTELRRLLRRLAPKQISIPIATELTAQQRLESLQVAASVVQGVLAHDLPLWRSALVLFSLLDGSLFYLHAKGCLRLGAFFGAFADTYRPAVGLLMAIAEYGENSDQAIVGAVFGLALMQSAEGRLAFTHALASRDIDIEDKLRSLDQILRHSRLTTRDLPVGFWDAIHAGSGDYRIGLDELDYLKKIPTGESLEAAVLSPRWIQILETSEDLTHVYYRGTPRTDIESRALKAARLKHATALLKKEGA